MAIKSVAIAELKDHLSEYLAAVRDGQEIEVRLRDRPIARIVPIEQPETADATERVLVAAGKMRLGRGRVPASVWRNPSPPVPLDRVLAALDAERVDD